MAYTKYSLTPADNNAAPPNGAPEGMLPSGVNDTMRDMMAQIRDVGDGIRDGTYTMTAPVITGGSINNTTVGATTPSTVKTTALTLTGSTSGTLAIAATAVAGTNTATFPAATGTVMVSGNMPAFSAYASSAQTITGSTFVKVNFTTEEFDTNSNFASSTFTPTVAGYYEINSAVNTSATTVTRQILFIYKNGVIYKGGTDLYPATGTANSRGLISSLVYANGTTDYFEIYVFLNATGTITTSVNSTWDTWFNGSMVRAA